MKMYETMRKSKKIRLTAFLLSVLLVFTCIPFPENAAGTVAAADAITKSVTDKPEIGDTKNQAIGMLVTREKQILTETYEEGASLAVVQGERGEFGKLNFGNSNTYYYSADVNVTEKSAGNPSIRLVLGYGVDKDTDIDQNGALDDRRYIELCIRPLDDGSVQTVLFLTHSAAQQYTYNAAGWVGTTTAVAHDSNSYTYTAKYENGMISFWLNDTLIFNQLDVLDKLLEESLVMQPGFYALGATGTLSNIKIWGDVREADVTDTMLVTNNGTDDTDNYITNKAISVTQNTRGTFENMTFGDTNDYWVSAKISATHTAQKQNIRMVLGTMSDGGKVEVDIRPIGWNDGSAALNETMFKDKWQSVVWAQYGTSATALTSGDLTAPSGISVNDGIYKASFTYTVHYSNGKISAWIDNQNIYYNKDLTTKIIGMTPQVGFYANGVEGTVSDVEIWGDVHGNNVADDMSVINNGSDATDDYHWSKSISVAQNTSGTFGNLTFGDSNNYWISAKVSAIYTAQKQNIRMTLGTMSDGGKVEVDIRPIGWNDGSAALSETMFKDKWQSVVWVQYGTSATALTSGDLTAPSGISVNDGVYKASFTYTIHYSNGIISAWIDDKNIYSNKDLTTKITGMIPQVGFHANGVSGTISDVKIWGDVTDGTNYVDNALWTGEDGTDYTYDYWKNDRLDMPTNGGILLNNLDTDGVFHMSMTLSYADSYTGKAIFDGFYLGTAKRTVGENIYDQKIYLGFIPNVGEGDLVALWEGYNNHQIAGNVIEASGEKEFTLHMSYATNGDIKLWKGNASEPVLTTNIYDRFDALSSAGTYYYSDFQFAPGIGNDDRGAKVPATVSNVNIWGDITVNNPNYISVAQPVTMISGDISLTREITSMSEFQEMMEGTELPSAALYNIDENLQVLDEDGKGFAKLYELLRLTGYQVLPIVRVQDYNTVVAISRSLHGLRFYDLCVISTNATLVKEARNAVLNARGALDLTERYQNKEFLSMDECVEIRREVHTNKVNDIYLPAHLCRQTIVQKLYDLQVDIWAVASDTLTETECYDVLLSGAFGIVSDATDVLLEKACSFENVTMTRMPAILAHRGVGQIHYGAPAPENTLESAILAYEKGTEAMEFDVHMTTDNVVVLMHDPTTTRTCVDENGDTVEWNVEEKTYAELQTIYPTKGYENTDYAKVKIPTLEQYLQEFKGKDFHLFIEVKSNKPEIVPLIKELVEEYDMYGQCTVKSCNLLIQNAMTDLWQEMPTALNAMEGLFSNGYLDAAEDPDEGAVQLAALMGKWNSYLHARKTGYDSDSIRGAQIRGINVCLHGYVTDEEEEENGMMKMSFLSGYYNLCIDGFKAMEGRVKTISVDNDNSVSVGSVLTSSLKYYMNKVREGDTISVDVLAGEDNVTIENGAVTFVKEGEATLLFKCTGEFFGTPYDVYTQPITVSIEGGQISVVPDSTLLGDCNGDQVVDIKDLVRFLNYKDGKAETNNQGKSIQDAGDIRIILLNPANDGLLPIWQGEIVYDESVLPLANSDGTLDAIPLLYKADNIVAVRSSDLKTTYTEGVDYKLDDNGRLEILPEGSIPSTAYDDIYLTESNGTNSKECTNGGYIYFSEDGFFHCRQLAVTYTHSDTFAGTVPQKQGNELSNIMTKLQNKDSVNVVFYGDSITQGASASSTLGASGMAPYMKKWSELVVNNLKKTYDYEEINHINTAVGGKDSAWGSENAQSLVADKNPDLLVLGFGMNDGTNELTTEQYKTNIQSIITTARTANANCDVILVATTLPNQEAKAFYKNQAEYLAVLNEIAAADENIVVADMTTMHQQLLKEKAFRDMTGNNINHPNDFLIRVYAQVILETLDK